MNKRRANQSRRVLTPAFRSGDAPPLPQPRARSCSPPRPAGRSAGSARLALLLAFAGGAAAQEQPAHVPADVQRMVRSGMTAALEARFRGSRKPEHLHLLARACANQAARLAAQAQRRQAFEQAERRYQTWIAALQAAPGGTPPAREVAVAQARVELAGMILSRWAARDLDQFELTAGRRADRAGIARRLQAARAQYEKALARLAPLVAQLEQREDEFLALGIYETIRRLELDIRFNLGWVAVYAAMVAPAGAPGRLALLRSAERGFQELLASSPSVGATQARCYLGLAMAQREQQHYEQAEGSFRRAMPSDAPAGLAAQARYELARCQISSGKFEEARITLRPLLAPAAAQHQASRFYVNLARLWEANSYLLEARALRRAAEDSAARRALRLRARRLSDTGLGKMNALALRGGAWAALVQLYVGDHVRTTGELKDQSALELLFAARAHARQQRYHEAERRFKEALRRENLPGGLSAQILLELAACQYERHQLRAAADTFEQLARRYPGQQQARRAAVSAYKLRAQIAAASKDAADYRRLAGALLHLLEKFPEQARQVEAAWWLPVALQAAGRYAQAARRFAQVPAASAHGEEAQFRYRLCRRLACEAARGTLPPPQYAARARQVADELARYAEQAYARAASAADPGQVRAWSAAALVNAAEMLVSVDLEQFRLGLALLEHFERRYPRGPLIGRVLAVRIRARNGLHQFAQAAELLDGYLRAVPSDQAGELLASLARGLQQELDRLGRQGQEQAARELARAAITTFKQLEQWCRADPARAGNLPAVRYGLARTYYQAGRLDRAGAVVDQLLQSDAQNGNLQRLRALILEARLGDPPSAAGLERAKQAWGALLRDPALRVRAPQRYWEARYHWLGLLLRQGRAAEVAKAIAQERIWNPQLGGPAWRGKLERLQRQASGKRRPASRPARGTTP